MYVLIRVLANRIGVYVCACVYLCACVCVFVCHTCAVRACVSACEGASFNLVLVCVC